MFNKGVFDSRVESVKEVCPFLGCDIEPKLLKGQQRKLGESCPACIKLYGKPDYKR